MYFIKMNLSKWDLSVNRYTHVQVTSLSKDGVMKFKRKAYKTSMGVILEINSTE